MEQAPPTSEPSTSTPHSVYSGYSSLGGLYFSERKLLLALGDLLLLNLSLLVALALRPEVPFTFRFLAEHLSWFVLLSAVWLLVSPLLDLYDLARAASVARSIRAASATAVTTIVAYSLIPYVTPIFPQRRLEALIFLIAALFALTAWRAFYAYLFVQPVFVRTALVIGADRPGVALVQAIAEINTRYSNVSVLGSGYHLIGFIDDDPAKHHAVIEGLPVLGTHADLVRLTDVYRPSEIIVALSPLEETSSELFQVILDCREMGIPITTMSSLYERLTGRVPVEHAGRDLNVVIPLVKPVGHRPYLALRTAVDLLFSILGVGLLSVLIPVIWVANRVASPGPLFYRQERVGLAGTRFELVKFRSMVMDAEQATRAVWAQEKDPRITKVGALLRKSRLDELPQVWNVLKGEMSVIGPRPERPEFVEQLARELPFYRLRHAIKPGITGWAQVKFRYGSSISDTLTKLQYDLYYIKHEGFLLDLLILLKTLQIVLGLKGR